MNKLKNLIILAASCLLLFSCQDKDIVRDYTYFCNWSHTIESPERAAAINNLISNTEFFNKSHTYHAKQSVADVSAIADFFAAGSNLDSDFIYSKLEKGEVFTIFLNQLEPSKVKASIFWEGETKKVTTESYTE